MSAAAEPGLILLAAGAGLASWRLVRRFEPAPASLVVPVCGLAATGLWPVVLALAGVRWRAPLILLPLAAAGLVAVVSRGWKPRLPRDGAWWVFLALAAVSCAVILATPAYGWDFRYIWGLKAKVYAGAAGFDPQWLAWPPNLLTHSHYPPLWSSAIATGSLLGVSVPAAASALTAVCAAGLGLACWFIARPAGSIQALAAGAVGLFAPGIVQLQHVGNAEAPLAVVFAAGLAALAEREEHSTEAPGGGRGHDLPVLLGIAVFLLPLIKVEGLALAVALVAGVASLGLLRRAALYFALAAASAGAWTAYLALHHVPFGEPRDLALVHVAGAAATIGHWLVRTRGGPAFPVLAIWVLLAPSLLRRFRGTTVALGCYALAVAFAYLTTLQPLEWQLTTSLSRVVAVPLPAALAVALRHWGWRRPEPS